LEQIRQEMREIIRKELDEYKSQLVSAIVTSIKGGAASTPSTAASSPATTASGATPGT
jgi:hypothetical protein